MRHGSPHERRKLLSDQSEEKAETKTNAESDYESEYSIYFPEKSDPELDYGSESPIYHYRLEAHLSVSVIGSMITVEF